MKLLLFSDIHCNETYCRDLVRRSTAVDVIVGAGDFCLMRKGLQETMTMLRPIQTPMVLVPGNSESLEELAAACRDWPNVHVLHGNSVELSGRLFFGVGGGIPVTPFGSWSYDFSEEDALELLAPCPPGAILVTHSPPLGYVDISSGGRHFGSRAVHQTIMDKSPWLNVCGHIHESAGASHRLGETIIVNAGPKGLLWEIPAP